MLIIAIVIKSRVRSLFHCSQYSLYLVAGSEIYVRVRMWLNFSASQPMEGISNLHTNHPPHSTASFPLPPHMCNL